MEETEQTPEVYSEIVSTAQNKEIEVLSEASSETPNLLQPESLTDTSKELLKSVEHNANELEGLNVWAKSQECLEQQALDELNVFAKHTKDVEDGEIIENDNTDVLKDSTPACNTTKAGDVILNLDFYIKKQEELRKRQEYKRSLQASEKSQCVAKKIFAKHHKEEGVKAAYKVKKRQEQLDCEASKKPSHHNEAVTASVEQHKCNDGVASGSEYEPSDACSSDSNYDDTTNSNLYPRKPGYKRIDIGKVRDDGNIELYKSRLSDYYKKIESETEDPDDYIELSGGLLKVPACMWNALYGYQQEGIRWLWSVHQKATGCLLGDEMGLGKTVQVIVFLAALERSHVSSCNGIFTGLGPSLIVCPVTVIHQWVQHFYEWAPEFRVVVLHSSGSYSGNKIDLIKCATKSKAIVITTYQGILKYKGVLVEHRWHYVILDEGHKIRNSSSKEFHIFPASIFWRVVHWSSEKGKRLIILHMGSETGFVDGALGSKKTGDYHKEMDGGYFEKWFKEVLPLLDENYPYHSQKLEKLPTTAWAKAKIINWLKEKKIQFNEDMLKVDLLQIVALHVIVEMALLQNKTVLCLPPYHCELNLIWAKLKDYVAKRNITYKFALVKELFTQAVSTTTRNVWKSRMQQVIKKIGSRF